MSNEHAAASTHPGEDEGGPAAAGQGAPDWTILRQVLERGPDALLVLDHRLRCRWANGLARKTLGLGSGTLVGESMCALVPALAGTPVERAFRAALADGRVHSIARVLAPSGRWFEVHALPIDSGLLAHCRDVTDTVATERALRGRERRYRRLVEHALALAHARRAATPTFLRLPG